MKSMHLVQEPARRHVHQLVSLRHNLRVAEVATAAR